MMGRIVDAASYSFSEKDRILVDANIWLYLFGPKPPDSRSAKSYSAVFKAVQVARTLVFLDVLVLSEFVNRFARDQHRVLAVPGAAISSDFKTFRDTPEFVPIAEAIQASVMKIGRLAHLIDHPLTAFDLPALLTDFAKGSRDLNDQLLSETCKKHGLALLSHDADLSHEVVTVLTTNSYLLRHKS